MTETVETMSVGDLLDALANYPRDLPLVMVQDGLPGYTSDDEHLITGVTRLFGRSWCPVAIRVAK